MMPAALLLSIALLAAAPDPADVREQLLEAKVAHTQEISRRISELEAQQRELRRREKTVPRDRNRRKTLDDIKGQITGAAKDVDRLKTELRDYDDGTRLAPLLPFPFRQEAI